ncbi:myomegalin-like protein [Labeo rohita]|uniref:Myomegalin-like protein n=1 Tax=Labeo rohita TaxID=84645 RepID=A0A498MT25_LABRO|nr:myomegalin-like protein [Labeo rohita]
MLKLSLSVGERVQVTSAKGYPLTGGMLHPLMIFMVVVNVSMSIIFWTFLMAEVFFKEAETEEAKAEAAASSA